VSERKERKKKRKREREKERKKDGMSKDSRKPLREGTNML